MSANLAQTIPHPPIAIGGVGGSGTRLVAKLLHAQGLYLGDDLNSASDNLWFTLLFKRREITLCDEAEIDLLTRSLVAGLQGGDDLSLDAAQHVCNLASQDRPDHDASWLRARARSLLDAAAQPRREGRWGWKEPNTHIVIERLWKRLPALRYIHVVRHGLDMAFSSNQNQLELWGEQLLGAGGPTTPMRSLAFWCRVHQHMQHLLVQNPTRMYWLDYDALCSTPEPILADLCAFLGLDASHVWSASALVRPQTPRHIWHSLDTFAPENIAYLRSLGYTIQHAHGSNLYQSPQ